MGSYWGGIRNSFILSRLLRGTGWISIGLGLGPRWNRIGPRLVHRVPFTAEYVITKMNCFGF